MKLTVYRVQPNLEKEIIATARNDKRARRIALAAAKSAEDGQVYITCRRESDGQVGYLNQDGYSPVGKAW